MTKINTPMIITPEPKILEPEAVTLIRMLKTRRPAGSETEKEFIREFITGPYDIDMDEYGNLFTRIGTAPVMWSSHTDTVHFNDGEQRVTYNPNNGRISLPRAGKPGTGCLGADCATGVWLMLEMIRAGVEGLYVFHREEECGGWGSKWIADETPEMLDGIQYAIAFDRKGTADVITHQFGGRCSSDKFADALALKLPGKYRADPTGSFTDTANYTDIVPECTNVSVGYYLQHSSREYQDCNHLMDLRNALVNIDTTNLPVHRDPTVIEDDTVWYNNMWRGYSSLGKRSKTAQKARRSSQSPKKGWDTWDYDQYGEGDYGDDYGGYGGYYADGYSLSKATDKDRMAELIMQNPEIVAEILDDYGITLESLQDDIGSYRAKRG